MSAAEGFFDHGECSRSINGERPPIKATYNHSYNQFPLPPLPPQSYSGLLNLRSAATSQFENLNDGQEGSNQQLEIVPGAIVVGKTTVQEIADAKAVAASKSHSEAERRRRERINNRLAKLRSILPSTTKTDKASLLTEVIQHLKELKGQASLIAETIPLPTETDELHMNESKDDDGGFVMRASLCCEDRPDLLPDLINALKGLRLRVLKADITTIGSRIRNVLFLTGDEDRSSTSNECAGHQEQWRWYYVSSIQEALKAVVTEQRRGGTGDESSAGNVKRQRTGAADAIERRTL